MTDHRPPEPGWDGSVQGELKPVAHLRAKAAGLLLFTLALILGSAFYLMYARGLFEPTQKLILTADDSEGVSVGMDMTFSGFAIGRVRRIELADDGNVRIHVDVARKDARWLRESSVFTLVKGLVGGTTIKAYSGMLEDAPLADGAVRPVLRGDATAELPQIMAAAKQVVENLAQITAQDSALGGSLTELRTLAERMQGAGGVLGVALGGEEQARKVLATVDNANATLVRLERMLARADRQVFDQGGLVTQVQATVIELNGLLADTRKSLTKIDAVLAEAQAVGANAREATTDLGALRAEVESNLRRMEGVLNELQGKWPFARQPELRLP
ncbi:MlaD family protein [Comamonas composti]|uniref:MlaD family protein n=1 Tax=Comamonas composti TaxID=408558 RepID=UPI000422E788|nr:MlaD family protein [Comamonas composti]